MAGRVSNSARCLAAILAADVAGYSRCWCAVRVSSRPNFDPLQPAWSACSNAVEGLDGRSHLLAQRPCQLAHRLLLLLVPYLGEVARDLKQHPLMWHDLPRPLFADTFVKISDRRAQGASNVKQPSGGYTIDTAL